jgi:hypothetical protein
MARFGVLSNNLSIYLSIYESIYLSIYGSTALCWTLTAFQFLNHVHSWWDSLDW